MQVAPADVERVVEEALGPEHLRRYVTPCATTANTTSTSCGPVAGIQEGERFPVFDRAKWTLDLNVRSGPRTHSSLAATASSAAHAAQ